MNATDRLVERRERLACENPNTVFVIPGAQAALRNGDVFHAYRQDSDLLYVATVDEPATLLLQCEEGTAHAVLYVSERTAHHARWEGPQESFDSLTQRLGLSDTRDRSGFEADLLEAIEGADSIAYRLGRDRHMDDLVLRVLRQNERRLRKSGRGFLSIIDPKPIIAELRLIKDAAEQKNVIKAGAIAADVLGSLAATGAVGLSGAELADQLEARVRQQGGILAFPTIVAIGDEASVLHARPSAKRIAEGDLVLVDLGVEIEGYAVDTTRTFSGSGAPTSEQASLIGWVKKALDEATGSIRPGTTLADVESAVTGVLNDAIHDLGLEGDLAHWMPHSICHWIGLDVHEFGAQECGGFSRELEEGMCLAVEPGIYVAADDARAPEALRGMGVRFEDTVLVTDTGGVQLTAG